MIRSKDVEQIFERGYRCALEHLLELLNTHHYDKDRLKATIIYLLDHPLENIDSDPS